MTEGAEVSEKTPRMSRRSVVSGHGGGLVEGNVRAAGFPQALVRINGTTWEQEADEENSGLYYTRVTILGSGLTYNLSRLIYMLYHSMLLP